MAHFNEIGSDEVVAFSAEGIRRVTETIRWGHGPADKARIALYYALRVASGLLRSDYNVTTGMYPHYWISDVRMDCPIGSFVCRGHTIDFDIVNPNYEAIEVTAFRERLDQLRGKSSVCIDMGAHIGKFSILAGRYLDGMGQVFAFEPDPSNFEQLQRNIALNGLRNVHAINAAGGGKDGVGMLSLSTTNIGAHTLAERPGARQIPVRVRSLDSFLHEQGVERVDIIKLDVEYAEAEVFRGARNTLESSPGVTVFFEETTSLANADSVRFLRSLSLRVEKLGRNLCIACRSEEKH